MKVLGFTGTENEPTAQQWNELSMLLQSLDANTLHHGDCIGADKVAHDIAYTLGYDIVIHPPNKSHKRAYCSGDTVTVLQPRPYLVRNKDIVKACSILIAVPESDDEVTRSGTWSTVRYARKLKRHIYIINQDGTVSQEERQF